MRCKLLPAALIYRYCISDIPFQPAHLSWPSVCVRIERRYSLIWLDYQLLFGNGACTNPASIRLFSGRNATDPESLWLGQQLDQIQVWVNPKKRRNFTPLLNHSLSSIRWFSSATPLCLRAKPIDRRLGCNLCIEGGGRSSETGLNQSWSMQLPYWAYVTAVLQTGPFSKTRNR